MSLITQLKDNVYRLTNALNNVKQSLISKGVDVSGGIDTYADKVTNLIDGVNVEDTTAIPSKVLDGIIFHDKNGEKQVGTMKNYGTQSFILDNATSSDILVDGYISHLILKTNIKRQVGIFTTSTEGTRIALNFKPNVIIVSSMQNGSISGAFTKTETSYYIVDMKDNSQFGFFDIYHNGQSWACVRNTKEKRLPTIDNNGFVYNARYGNKQAYYVALQI